MISSYSSTFHQSSIIGIIEEKESISDLIPIIEHLSNDVDLNNLKNILKDAVIQSKPCNTKEMYYSIMNIEKMLPNEILQHIESFNHSLNLKSVSKTFKQCFDLNESIQLRQRELLIKNELEITEK
eukprot:161450_1